MYIYSVKDYVVILKFDIIELSLKIILYVCLQNIIGFIIMFYLPLIEIILKNENSRFIIMFYLPLIEIILKNENWEWILK